MDRMKDYKQLIQELPSKTVVFAFGRFNPPTIGHELLVKAVKKLAQQKKADHVIYASRSQDAKKNPLSVDKKVKYLNLMFKGTNFAAADADARTFIEVAKVLNKKYKNIVMVAGSDRVPEFTRLLNSYNGKDFNFNTIEVISAGERDPDADDATGMSASKMRALAVKGDYAQFKKGLPSSVREIDGRRLMNDIREGMGLESIKEQINLVKDDLREKYFRGEIFNEGDIVECAGEQYTIVKRGSNHLLLKESSGTLVSKWIQDVTPTEQTEDMNEDLTSKTVKTSDALKVARVIATMLGVDNAESSANPTNLINLGLRKVRSKALNPEAVSVITRMLKLADSVGVKYDAALLPAKIKEGVIQPNGTDKIEIDSTPSVPAGKVGRTLHDKDDQVRKMKIKHQLGESESVDMTDYEADYVNNVGEEDEISDDELDALADQINDIDDIMDAYDDEELSIVDSDTGEEVGPEEEELGVNEQVLSEVLSRMERMRAKVRMRRTQAKRERRLQIALKRRSDTKTINKRSRRLAVKLMKQRLLRGRDPSKISVGEKERVERVIERRKKVLGRLAMRLAPRVRKIENARMTHSKYTASAPAVGM
jgi:hypothetical protein